MFVVMSFSAQSAQLPPSATKALLQHGNRLDLNGHSLWQLVYCDTSPRRLVREVLLVLSVHLRKVLHVSQEDLRARSDQQIGIHGLDVVGGVGDAYTNSSHFIHTGARGLEDGFDVFATLGRLVGNGAFD